MTFVASGGVGHIAHGRMFRERNKRGFIKEFVPLEIREAYSLQVRKEFPKLDREACDHIFISRCKTHNAGTGGIRGSEV